MKLISLISTFCLIFVICAAKSETLPIFLTRSYEFDSKSLCRKPASYFIDSNKRISFEIEPGRFGLPELTNSMLCVIYPVADNLSIGWQTEGLAFDKYSRLSSAICVSGKINEMIIMQAGINLQNASYRGYGTQFHSNIILAGMIELPNELRFAFLLDKNYLARKNDTAPQGSYYLTVSGGGVLGDETSWDCSASPLNTTGSKVAASLSHEFHRRIKASVEVGIARFSLGSNLNIILDTSSSMNLNILFHNYLGWASGIGLNISF